MTFTTIYYIVVSTLLSGTQLLFTGIILGIGFYIAKQITNWLDERRVLKDKAFMDELSGNTVPAV